MDITSASRFYLEQSAVTPLDAFLDERIVALKTHLGGQRPTAIWHATGVRTGYRHTFDTRTHRIEAPSHLQEAIRIAVYADPGLHQLLAYSRNVASFDANSVKIRLSFVDTVGCALLQQGAEASVVVMLGLDPDQFILPESSVWAQR